MPTSARCRVLAIAALGAAVAAAAAGRRVVDLKIGPFRIQAHRDREVCQAVRVRGVPGMEVISSAVRSRTSRGGAVGTHHFVAYGYRGADSHAFPTLLADDPGCNGFGPSDFYNHRVSLAGSGGERRRGPWLVTETAVPPGLSQPLPNPADAPEDAVIVLNSHYFNLSPRPARGYVKLRLVLGPADPHKRVLRQLIALDASRTIDVAPGTTGRETAAWQADGAANPATEDGMNPPGDVCLLYLTGHMHKRGARFTLAYEQEGKPPEPSLLDFRDYVHPSVVYYRQGFLLPRYSAENGHPLFRYACEHANGAAGKPVKTGCEAEPGVAPGLSWTEASARGISALESHARPCGQDGANCAGYGTGRCVPANLVFGPLSDDEMCILVGAIYDPIPGLPADQACDPSQGK
jgi:hypothetical protein